MTATEIASILKDIALILVSFSALFYVYRIRKAEKIRREYDVMTECFVNFSKLANAIYDWTRFIQYVPVDENGKVDHDAPDRNFQKELSRLYPRAWESFLKAKLLMLPEAIAIMEQFFLKVRNGISDNQSSRTFFKAMNDIRGDESPEMQTAYHDYKDKAFAYEKAAKEVMPKEIADLLSKLESQLRKTVHSWR